MRDTMKLLKRLMAFLLCLLTVTTMMGDDFYSFADGEESTAVESEQASAPAEEAPLEQAAVSQPAEVAAGGTSEEATTAAEDAPELANASLDTEPESSVGETETTTTLDGVVNSDANEQTPNIDENKTGEVDENVETAGSDTKNIEPENGKKDNIQEDGEEAQSSQKDSEEIQSSQEVEEEAEDDSEEVEDDQEETEDSQEEECKHESYYYKSNNNGSHGVYCEDCDEHIDDEACEYDNAGKCKRCGYESIINKDIEKSFDGLNFVIKGRMPKDAQVEIKVANLDVVEDILSDNGKDDYTIFRAYDITIKDGSGNIYQPEDHGYSLSITVKGISEVKKADSEDVSVLRVEHDNETLTELKSEINNDVVTFDSEHFSVIIIGEKTSEILGQEYIEVESDETISVTDSFAQISNEYARVSAMTIYVYLEAGEVFECTADIRKGLPDLASPLMGTKIITCHDRKEVSESGWYPITINFEATPESWLPKSSTSIYSISLHDFANTVIIQKGSMECYKEGTLLDARINASVNKAYSNQPYAISSIVLSSKKGKTITAGKEIYYAQNEEDELIVTAKDSNGTTYDVNVSWQTTVTSGTAPIQLNDGVIKANNPGRVKVTASFGGSTSAEYTIVVYAIKLNGSTAAFSKNYTGSAIEPVVTLNDGSADISSGAGTFTTSYSNNINVGNATVTIAGAGGAYSFTKGFTIRKRNLNDYDFAAARYTIATASDTVTNIENLNKKSTVEDTINAPTLGEDFTIDISRKGIRADGILYEAAISAAGANFTGTINLEEIIYTADNLRLADYVDITWKNTPNKTYNAAEITFARTDFYVKDKAGNLIELNLDMDYEDNVSGDENHFGTVVFTDGSATPVYQGEIRLQFYIAPANIAVGEFTATWDNDVSTFTHTGSRIEPGDKLTLTYKSSEMQDAQTLVENRDYTLAYSNNINTGVNSALITITGKGNYTGTQTVTFSIQGAFGIDAVVYVNNRYRASNATASEAGDWVSGFSLDYSGSVQMPESIRVTLAGKGTIPDSDYTVAYADNMAGTETLTAKAGKKYIIITGGARYNNEKIYVSYEISPISISSSRVAFALTDAGRSKAYGKEDDPGEAINLRADDYTLKFNNVAMSAEDYTIECTNNVNATTVARYSITGRGNFTGTRTGYYTIAPATLTGEMISFRDGNPLTINYSGTAKEPEVLVSLRNVDMTGNYDLQYTDNIGCGVAKVTITPKNNLTGDVRVKTFTIEAKPLSSLSITLAGYPVSPVTGVNRAYFCSGYAPTYTGRAMSPEVVIKDGDIVLRKGTEGDYTTSYKNRTAVSDFEEHRAQNTLDQAAYVEVKGKNNYQCEAFRIYFNIVKRELNRETTTVTGKNGEETISTSWTANTVNKPQDRDIKVTYNNTVLSYGTDFEIQVEDTNQAKLAGAEINAEVVGKGNYRGRIAFTYNVGASIDGASTEIQLINPLTNEVYSASNKDARGNYNVTWLPGNNKPTVRVKVNDTTITEDADYTLTYTASQADDYNSYDGENVVAIEITGKGGYYGTKSVGYHIMPISLSTARGVNYADDVGAGLTVKERYDYTYEYDRHVIDVGDNLEVHYKVGDTDYILNSRSATTDYTFKNDARTIGPNGTYGGATYRIGIVGTGNFSGELTIPVGRTSYTINQVNLSNYRFIPRDALQSGQGTIEIIESPSNPLQKDSEGNYYAIYTGEPIDFSDYMVVKDKDGNTLTKNVDYIVRNIRDGVTTNVEIGSAAKVFVDGKAASNYTGTKEITFEIRSIGINSGDFTASIVGQYTYNGQRQIPQDVIVKDGAGRTLTRHTDYDIVGVDTNDDLNNSTYIGNNTDPGAYQSNWITVRGKGQYSGEKKVYFDIDLDIGASGFAQEVDNVNHIIVSENNYARIEIRNTADYGSLPEVTLKYKKRNASNAVEYSTINPTTTGVGATSEKNYEVTKDATAPGPGRATITGCNNGSYNCVKGSQTFTGIDYLADLSEDDYTEQHIGNYARLAKLNYAYEGSSTKIKPAVTVSAGVKDVDYTVTYSVDLDVASSVGEKTVTIAAKPGSHYFKEGKSIELKYFVKYDLDSAEIAITGVGITWDAANSCYTASYTGSKIIYGVRVTAGGVPIHTTGTSDDYVIISEENDMTNPGSHIVKVAPNTTHNTVMGAQRLIPFTIVGKSISTDEGWTLTIAPPNDTTGTTEGYYYTGTNIRPATTVRNQSQDITLVAERDYIVSYSNNYNVGTATVTVTGIGAYAGTLSGNFNIIARPLTANAGINVIVDEAHYVGHLIAVKPDFKVTYGGNVLTKDVDYTFIYDDNVPNASYQAANGLIKITGRGNFSGEITETFAINQLDLRRATVIIDGDSTRAEYTGNEIIPAITIKVQDYDGEEQELIECSKNESGEYVDPANNDYKITVVNQSNTVQTIREMGSYVIKIGGTNINCVNERTVNYEVTRRSIANNWKQPGNEQKADKQIEISVSDVETFDGTAVPASLTIEDSGAINSDGSSPKVLREGVDYTVTYVNNTTGGKGEYTTEKDTFGNYIPEEDSPYALIRGINNYSSDEVKVVFNIGKNLEQMEADGILRVQTLFGSDAEQGRYVYDGEEHAPGIKLTILDGTENGTALYSGEDYNVTIKNARGVDERIHAGRRTITIKGTGRYYGKIERSYDIVKRQVLGSVDYTNRYNPENTTFTFQLSDPNMRVLEDGDEDMYGEEFLGYYFATYAGRNVTPRVALYDRNLATESKLVDPSQYEVTYRNNSAAFDPTNTDLSAFAYARITFKEDSDYDGSSSSFIGYYLIGPDSIEDNTFTVRFAAEGENQTNFVFPYTGEAVCPQMVVTDTDTNTQLTRGRDYDTYYVKGTNSFTTADEIISASRQVANRPITPGECEVYVIGKGSYQGIRSRQYAIVADLSDRTLVKVVSYDTSGREVNGIRNQFLTGREIVPEFEVRLYETGGTRYITLRKDVDYRVTVSSNNWMVSGTAIINALGDYYTRSTTENFNVVLDTSMIHIVDENNFVYTYSGYEIKPVFSTDIDSLEIASISYRRIEGGTGDNDFINKGRIQADLTLKLSETGQTVKDENGRDKKWTVTYEIRPISMNSSAITVIYNKTQRFIAEPVKPEEILAYIDSVNPASGENQRYVLEKGSDFTISYGGQVINAGTATLAGANANFTGTRIISYKIELYPPAGFKVINATDTSLTVEWQYDIFAKGVDLKLEKVDDNRQVVGSPIFSKAILRTDTKTNKATYRFENLECKTNYKVSILSIGEYNGTNLASSKTLVCYGTTDTGKLAGFEVKSEKAKEINLSWPAKGNTTETWGYFVYRATNATDEGRLLAVIPNDGRATISYTNSRLTTGKKYYYYIVECKYVDGQWQAITETARKSAIAK